MRFNKPHDRKKALLSQWYPLVLGIFLSVLLGIGQLGPLGYLDLKLLDLAFHLRGSRPAPAELIILGIDEDSFRKIDAPFALWNGHFALVFEYLARTEARVVGFDLIQSKPFNMLIAEDNQRLLEVVDEINSQEQTGLVFAYLPDKNLYPFQELRYLLVEVNGLGYTNLTLDDDKIVRRQELFAKAEKKLIPSFSLSICSKFLEEDPESVLGIGSEDKDSYPPGRLGRTMLINFRGPPGTIPKVSFAHALEKAQAGDISYFRENFSGRIVLIGLDTLGDSAPVAYSGKWNQSVLMPGVEIHANIISTILTGETIRELSAFIFRGVPFVICAFLLCFLFSRFPLGWGIVLTISLMVGVLLTWKVLFAANIYLGTATPLALLVLAPLTTYSYRFLVEGRDKRRLRRIFSSYVNEKVLEELISRDDYTVFSVKRKPVTLMFTDVRNFTSISEPLPPEIVARILNEYMTEMCKAIFEFGGTVNKFLGDGIMAMWGAPVEDSKGCRHAVQAALRMLELLNELNRRWEPQGYRKFEIGVGIHYANVAVGYLGHPDRMEYTALGDGVNTASRVESVNKELNTNILVTDKVYDFIKEEFVFGKPTITPVKGRSKVKVYEILGIKEGPK